MARIPEEKIDEVRTSVNIVHYISQFINLKKSGQNFKGLCPFHTEKTPSFMVSPQKQIFHCFGCGRGGNVFTFVMDYNKISFIEAVQRTADFAGIILPKQEEASPEEVSYFERLYNINESACSFFEKSLAKPQYKKHLEYIRNRQISDEVIKAFRLGFAPDSYDQLLTHLQNEKFPVEDAEKLGLIQKREKSSGHYSKFRYRIIFPFQNISGRIMGFGGRKLEEKQQPKYLNSPENPIYKKGSILYGLHQAVNAIRKEGYVILVEGYFDLLRLVENGMKNVVASSGTALTEDQVKLIRRYTRDVYIAYDSDNAGIKAAFRSAVVIEKGNLNAFIVSLPAGDDPDTFVLNNGIKEFNRLIDKKLLPVDFQITKFLQNNSSPGIEQKNAFLDEVLNNLLELKNSLKIGLYIHQLSDKLQINESFLIDQLNKLKRYRSKYAVTEVSEKTADESDVIIRKGAHKAEAGILGVLINGKKSEQDFILQEISLDLFENEDFIELFEYLLHEIEDHGNLDSSKLISSFQENARLNKLISELMLVEFEDGIKFSRDCIFQLRKWQLEKKSSEILILIKEEQSSPDALLHYKQELMEYRKQLNTLETAHRRIK